MSFVRCVPVALLAAACLAATVAAAPAAGVPGGPDAALVMPAVNANTWSANGTVRAVARLNDTLFVGGDFWKLSVPTGAGFAVDARSGSLERPTPAIAGYGATVAASVSDGAGGWFVGGAFTSAGGMRKGNVAHILADGTVTDWSPNVAGNVRALARSGNTLYVGGNFASVAGQPRAYLAAFDVVSGALLPWNPGASDEVFCLAATAQTVYAGGSFGAMGGQARQYLAAVDAASGAVLDWNPGPSSIVLALALNGSALYAGGDFTQVGGVTRHFVAAFDLATGALNGWDPEAVAPPWDPNFGSDIVCAIAATDSTVYVGGYFTALGGLPRHCCGAVNARTGQGISWNPSLDPGYASMYYPIILSIAVDGPTVCIGGVFSIGWTNWRENIAGVDATTGIDLGWNASTYLATLSVAAGGGRAFVGGVFSELEIWRDHLASFDLRTGDPTGWDPSPNGPVNALAVDTGRRTVFAGGSFSATTLGAYANLVALDPIRGIAVVSPATGEVLPCPGVNGAVNALACDGNVLYVGGEFTAGGDSLLPRHHLASVETETGALTAWAPDLDGPVDALALGGASVFAGGRFANAGGQPRAHLAALDPATDAPTSFRADADGAVRALFVDRGTLYAGGEFASIGGEAHPYLAALDAATGAASAWAPAPDGPVSVLSKVGGAVIAGGAFHAIGGQSRGALAALDGSSALSLPWNPSADGEVRALSMLPGSVFAGGAFTNMGGGRHPGLALVAYDDAPSASVPRPPNADALALSPPAPNPARASVRLRFTLPAAQRVSLAVYDLAGRRVARVLNAEPSAAGPHELRVRTDTWPAGVYLCRLDAGARSCSRKLLVVR